MARQRLDLKAAAETLGTSVDAVRKRIQRGTLESAKGEDGRVYVWLDLDQTVREGDSHLPLLAAKDETIALLRRELEVWQEEARRKDHIIAALTERIPELEPASSPEASESPVTASASVGKGAGTQDRERPPRSFWRRFFGI